MLGRISFEQLRTIALDLRRSRWGIAGYRAGVGMEIRRDDYKDTIPAFGTLGAWLNAWTAEWGRAGLPSVRMGHRQAAALMATQVAPGDIRAPWPVFLVHVPDRLLSLVDSRGELDALQMVLVISHSAEKWSYCACADHCEYTSSVYDVERMRAKSNRLDDSLWDGDPLSAPVSMTEHDDRAVHLLERLLLNTCVLMSDAERAPVRELGKRPAGYSVPPLAADGGRTYGPGAYELTHAVRVDCRPAVAEYMAGERHAAPSVRVLVRGHWRWQAHGAGRALRRRQWIEPFWRGPDTGPVAVRDHVIPGAPPAPVQEPQP